MDRRDFGDDSVEPYRGLVLRRACVAESLTEDGRGAAPAKLNEGDQ